MTKSTVATSDQHISVFDVLDLGKPPQPVDEEKADDERQEAEGGMQEGDGQ